MPTSGSILLAYPGRLGGVGLAVTGVQAISRETATAAQDMGLRRVKTSVWVGDVAFGKSSLVHVFRRPF